MSKNWAILHIRNGEIQNKSQVKKLFDQLHDGKWLIEIGQANKRSDQQNRYYWAVVVPMVQHGIMDLGTELTKEETHDFLKARFNYSEIASTEGELMQVPRSTTILNKEAFSHYILKIQIFASEFLGIVIPDPGVQLKAEME